MVKLKTVLIKYIQLLNIETCEIIEFEKIRV